VDFGFGVCVLFRSRDVELIKFVTGFFEGFGAFAGFDSGF
jgi:hypothetical protein